MKLFIFSLLLLATNCFAQTDVLDALVKDWCFQYQYDGRHRLTHKKVPGAAWVYMVYDDRDRLVMTQDGEQRKINKWTVMKYDDLNRLVSTGIHEHPYAVDQQAMAALVTTTSFDDLDILTQTYYDNYSFSAISYAENELNGQDNFSPMVIGMVTGTKVKVLGSKPSRYLLTTNYYDDRGRLVQSASENYGGDVDRITHNYDFTGKITSTRERHSDETILKIFEFDHSGRLLMTRHSINGGDTIILSKYEYNEIGQPVVKRLHSTDGINFSQDIGYRYNIRGWVTSIDGDLFGMDLMYNDVDPALGNKALFNGNVSGVRWNNGAYAFSYDPMNRLATATRAKNAFTESGVTYDLNGNIKTLNRSDETGTTVDRLTYTYDGNLLRSVNDASTAAGFRDEPNNDIDYSYDDNGNLIRDNNKNITSIIYNILNLPGVIINSNGDSVLFYYDATGKKLRQVVTNSKKRTDYFGDFIYENDTLKFINHGEGRAIRSGSGFVYEYHLRDHLGNVRKTFTTKHESVGTLVTLEESDVEKERADVLRYDLAKRVRSHLFDHTKDKESGDIGYSVRLNGSRNERIGLAKSISVMPGDTIRTEVFAKFVDPGDELEPALRILLGYFAAPVSAPPGTIIDGPGYVNSDMTSLGIAPINHSGDDESEVPKAYLNYIFINRNYELSSMRPLYTRIYGSGEDGSNLPHAHLKIEDVITEPGYVYIYLSNDSEQPREVYFDDFKVLHVKSPIIQSQDYYPFGLAFNEYHRENTLDNLYQYNGMEKQDALDLSWLDYGARMYMPEIARWAAIDPKAEKNAATTPYSYVLNNPVNAIDPDGRDAILLAFPDYKIETPIGRVGGLGHAGVLLIDNKTGLTRYYEYGRYDAEEKGWVKTRRISNVVIDKKTGKPTAESLNKVLGQISKNAGHGGRIRGAYVNSNQFDAMKSYADGKMAENADPNRKKYDLNSNNCGTFARDVIRQDETVDNPTIFNPTPRNIIDEYIEEGNAEVRFDPKSNKTTMGLGDEDDAKKRRGGSGLSWMQMENTINGWLAANPNIQITVK